MKSATSRIPTAIRASPPIPFALVLPDDIVPDGLARVDCRCHRAAWIGGSTAGPDARARARDADAPRRRPARRRRASSPAPVASVTVSHTHSFSSNGHRSRIRSSSVQARGSHAPVTFGAVTSDPVPSHLERVVPDRRRRCGRARLRAARDARRRQSRLHGDVGRRRARAGRARQAHGPARIQRECRRQQRRRDQRGGSRVRQPQPERARLLHAAARRADDRRDGDASGQRQRLAQHERDDHVRVHQRDHVPRAGGGEYGRRESGDRTHGDERRRRRGHRARHGEHRQDAAVPRCRRPPFGAAWGGGFRPAHRDGRVVRPRAHDADRAARDSPTARRRRPSRSPGRRRRTRPSASRNRWRSSRRIARATPPACAAAC